MGANDPIKRLFGVISRVQVRETFSDRTFWLLLLDFLGLESVKDTGNLVQEASLSLWANFRQRALDIAMLEINNKTDVKIEVESIERAKHLR